MATSLAEQLKRLATPQTAQIVDSKKRDSILFDIRDAANKDREIIYDIGLSGLHELASLNPAFLQYEQTLFDRSARDLVRSVESAETNAKLDKQIKRFLIHLSPHFLLQPAHKCLEWLIRRFQVHEFNVNDLMMLILPYHETRIFVRCVQILNLRDAKNRWAWLRVLQKPGITLSKQVLFNRASTDQFLLKLICKFTEDAVSELGLRAYTLQSWFAFFCTTLLGVLETTDDVSEKQISAISPTLAKGLASEVTDLCAASMMILGYLVTKVQLAAPILEILVQRLAKITHPGLQTDAVVLLVLCYKTQVQSLQLVSDEALDVIVANKWIPFALSKNYEEKISILPFFLPLLAATLKTVQLKERNWKNCKSFCENLLAEVSFGGTDAEDVIRCLFNAYVLRDKPNAADVITIDSEDDADEIELTDTNVDINHWYSDMLRSLERQYPTQFEKITKEVMRNADQDTNSDGAKRISKSKRRSLKTVLGFLFTAACAGDGANIFENLYHHNVEKRVGAMKYLVQHLNNSGFSDDSKNLLRDSIAERLSDDSPLVVLEALRFDAQSLVQMLEQRQLIEKLKEILKRSLHNAQWNQVARAAITHITSELVCSESNWCEIFFATWPFLFPISQQDIGLNQLVIQSPLNRLVPLLKCCQHSLKNVDQISQFIVKTIAENRQQINHPDVLLATVQTALCDKHLTVHTAYFGVLLAANVIPSKCPPATARVILAIIIKVNDQHHNKLTVAKDNQVATLTRTLSTKNLYPIQLHLMCLADIIKSVEFAHETTFDDAADTSSQLKIKLIEIILNGLWTSKPKIEQLYQHTFKTFVAKTMPTVAQQVDFFSHFYVAHFLELQDISPVLQVQAIRVLTELLTNSDSVDCSLASLIRIISGCSSPHDAIRSCTIDTLKTLLISASLEPQFKLLIEKILARTEELLLDDNQLVLVIYRVFTKAKPLDKLLERIFELIATASTATLDHALALHLTTHINNTAWCRKIGASSLRVLNTIPRARHVIGVQQSAIVRLTLLRFTMETVAVLRSPTDHWTFLLTCIQNYQAQLQAAKGSNVAVAVAALNVFHAELFAQLPEKHRNELVKQVLLITVDSPDADVLLAAGKFMRRIDLDVVNHWEVLQAMQRVDVVVPLEKGLRRKSQTTQLLSTDILATTEWRCGNAFLEYVQNKAQIANPHQLLPSLFLVLKRCLQFEDQSPVEYTKQLVLSCMLHFCQLISPDGKPQRSLIPDKVFEITLVVQCIRNTQNPQTHHHALQLLSHTAAMIPELVLHNMMDIFTFVGSSVVRRDDAYTYQIISNIIKSIIPTLIATTDHQSNADGRVIPVLRVFADIVLDVPEHRRMRLYADLLNTLGAQQYTWMFLAVLFEGYVRNSQQPNNKVSESAQLKRIEIAVEIANNFECDVVLETVTRLIEFLHKQPSEKQRPAGSAVAMDIDITDTTIFNIHNYSDYQLRHFKYITLQFIIKLTEPASLFVQQMASMNATATAALKAHFKQIIVTVLQFIGRMHKLKTSAAAAENIWKVLLANCYDILDQVLAMIYPDMLLQVVGGLLNKNNIPEVRRKVIELLNKKLQLVDFFATSLPDSLLALLEPLSDIIESVVDDSKLPRATLAENVSLQQQSLMAIKLLSVQVAKEHPVAFRPILTILSTIVKSADTIPVTVLAQSILCLGEVCSHLRAHAISHLSKFMPALDKILQHQVTKVHTTPNILIYILTGVYKIIETLPLFLSPYLVSLIVSLSTIWTKLAQGAVSVDTQRNVHKLELIWAKLANVLTLRILIPVIDHSYKRIIEERSEFGAVGPVMRLLAASLQPLTGSEIQPFQTDLGTFFVAAMQFRANECNAVAEQVITLQEDHVIGAFVGMVMKLSESSFRPLYHRMFDWAIRGEATVERAITFYRLSSKIAESLKSLFVLFASDFFQNAAELLAKCTKTSPTKTLEFGDTNSRLLVSAIVRTVYLVCLHDSQGFVNTHRFEILLAPLVDQLQNHLVLDDADVKEQIPACLAQLAVAVNEDTAWKQLNYQILLKTRNPDATVRLFALAACVEIAKKLGDDFLPLLPETIPFFAEMLEDENPSVERACQASVQDLEKVLGEPLQKYF